MDKKIYFSGDDDTDPVQEQITIDRTLNAFSVWLHSYGSGSGKVTFEWDGVEPCPDNWGCTKCTDWNCKPPKVPVCQGDTNNPTCMSPEDAAKQVLTCDNVGSSKTEGCDSKLEFNIGTCNKYPTRGPTSSPSDIPTKTPTTTMDPTTSPTTGPSKSPTTSPTTIPSGIPTDIPTDSPNTSTPTTSPLVPCDASTHCSGHGETTDPDSSDGCDCKCKEGYWGEKCQIPPNNCICGAYHVDKGVKSA